MISIFFVQKPLFSKKFVPCWQIWQSFGCVLQNGASRCAFRRCSLPFSPSLFLRPLQHPLHLFGLRMWRREVDLRSWWISVPHKRRSQVLRDVRDFLLRHLVWALLRRSSQRLWQLFLPRPPLRHLQPPSRCPLLLHCSWRRQWKLCSGNVLLFVVLLWIAVDHRVLLPCRLLRITSWV